MDLEFISGDYFEIAIPKDKAYLNRYFTTDIQRQFLRYMLVFGHPRHFCEHTGYVCARRNLQILHRRMKELESAHLRAKEAMDFDVLECIEKGMYKLKIK